MPNWVFTRLAVAGPPAYVSAFVERVRPSGRHSNKEGAVLDFERIVPMPDDLRGSDEAGPDAPHGLPRWYTWAVEHWGTKWNAWYSSLEGDPQSGEVTYSFQTAWSPPDMWLGEASLEFPQLEFRAEYVEELGHFAGRGLWRDGDLVEHEALEPEDVSWAQRVDDEEEEDVPRPEPQSDIGEPLDENAVHRAAWLVESVIELGMNAQRRRRMSADYQTWIAAVTEHVGAAARCARLIAAANEATQEPPDEARDARGRSLIRHFSANLIAVGAEAIHAAAYFRMWHEGGVDSDAREVELTQALETALESDDRTSTGSGPSDWLVWVVRYLGEAGDAVTAAERVRLGHDLPEWVQEDHDSADDAARFAFGMLASACIQAVALFAPEDLAPEEIDQPRFWDEISVRSRRKAAKG